MDLNDLFKAYMHYGGMPGIADAGLNQNRAMTLLDGVYSTVVIRDILEREAEGASSVKVMTLLAGSWAIKRLILLQPGTWKKI